ncbi:MAG: crotonase/enoyl-CoA hydratase family protein [Rhodobacteraceae bacterium]|nr:crotonase/enoyl-CoA hydratase family protein [Paracoccaceae bacterium]
MFETISLRSDRRGVAHLQLERPARHNALSAQMMAELKQAAGLLAADDSVRAVVLCGAGTSFCAGGDLQWMQAQMAAEPKTRFSQARRLAETLQALNNLPKPLIGRIHGNAFGGGVGLACVCDVAIGVDTARFGLTETRLGLIPATIGPYVLARMGASMARRVFMSSRIFSAEEAVRLNLLAKAVAAAELDAAVEAEVLPYLHCAPQAVARAKALLHQLGPAGEPTFEDAAIDRSVRALVACWEGGEAPEGIAAFFEKRKPAWVK